MEEEGDVIDDVVTIGGAPAGVTLKAGEIIFLLLPGLGVTSSLEEDMCGDRIDEEEECLDVLGELGTGDRK